ncbi:hypothetical protein [Pseudomonas sp. ML2-2023-6]|uniref:hypothetical protein n=1 Tax=Pseudomonas sp. ML2-2023-6 TaxID=3122376 RepID=UPI0030CB0533
MKDQIMKVSDRTRSGGRVLASCCLALLAGLATLPVQAVTIPISAHFSPDSSNPQINEFKNTTADSGICAIYATLCRASNLFSISLRFEARTQRAILAKHANPREGAMIKVPANDRIVLVTNSRGQSVEIKLSITAFSATHNTSNVGVMIGMLGLGANDSQNRLWAGAWGAAASMPCTLGSFMGAAHTFANYFWWTPREEICAKSPSYEIDSLRLSNPSVSYRMTTPDPLKMESGTYEGSLTYSVGPGGDFDFGDNLLATDDSVTLNFTLTVEHTLKFQFPAGYGSVTLNPAGGWQQWLNKGRRPEKLWADQRFKIWASSPFSVTLQCDNALNDQCAIKNAAGHTVPVATRLTLPGGLRNASNQTLERFLLSTNPEVISPSQYVDNGNATLHFEVDRDQVKTMIDEHSGSTYKGNITVIWNSEI